MTRESIEELKARLLRDPEVQTMIRMRAYEIYRIRGQQPGRQAEDWFQAQGEVLEFLIEEESRHTGDDPQPDPQVTDPQPDPQLTAVAAGDEPPSRPVEHTASGAGSESSLGVWSATEPDSVKLAPPVGKATEFQIDGPKKPRARTSTKAASPGKSKAKANDSATESTAKKISRRATAKKDADSSKSKRNRKK